MYVIRIVTKSTPCYLADWSGQDLPITYNLSSAKTFIYGMEAVEKIKELEKDYPKRGFFWEEIKP
jgi:hypothetical protein